MSGYNDTIDAEVAAGRREPVKGQTYSTLEIFNDLALADSPFLQVPWNGKNHNIQTAHMSCEMQVAWAATAAANARWEYVQTTREWCPIFVLASGAPHEFADAERRLDYNGAASGYLWLTPKGHPRKQF